MENIRLYDLESTYHDEKSSFQFPTVAYTIDTDTVWYMKPTYEITDWIVDLDNVDEGSVEWYDLSEPNKFDLLMSYKKYDSDWFEFFDVNLTYKGQTMGYIGHEEGENVIIIQPQMGDDLRITISPDNKIMIFISTVA